MLLVLQRRVTAAGATLRLCGLQTAAREACTATRLDTVFDIHPDVPAALTAI
jgi:anti-anti-sigma regulatory factor